MSSVSRYIVTSFFAISLLLPARDCLATSLEFTEPQESRETLEMHESRLKTLERQMAMGKGASQTSNGKVEVQLYGQVSRALMYAGDGKESNWYHVDNDSSGTRVGLRAKTKVKKTFFIGAKFEVELQSNASNVMEISSESTGNINYDSNSGTLNERHLDVYLQSEKLGKLSAGQGNTASYGASTSDLSDTCITGLYAGVDGMGGAFSFYNTTDQDYSDGGQVDDFYNKMDGLGRKDRLRYDSPRMASFTLAGSLVEKDASDVAIYYKQKLSGLDINAAAAYAQPGRGNNFKQTNGSVSFLLNSGFYLNMATGQREMDDSSVKDPFFYYVNTGYIAKFSQLGSTTFLVDYGQWKDLTASSTISDDAVVYGIGFLQNTSIWNTEIYGAYRIFALDRGEGVVSGKNFNDIKVFWLGIRFKFST